MGRPDAAPFVVEHRDCRLDRDDEPKLPLLQLLIVAALLWVGLAALTALAVYWYW